MIALIGTPAASSIARYQFHGHGLLVAMIVAPSRLPGLFVGTALLTFFVSLGVRPPLVAVVIAHVVCALGCFVVVAAAPFFRRS